MNLLAVERDCLPSADNRSLDGARSSVPGVISNSIPPGVPGCRFCGPAVVWRRWTAVAVTIVFSGSVFWVLSASRFKDSFDLVQVLGAGLFLLLFSMGSFNLFLYVAGAMHRGHGLPNQAAGAACLPVGVLRPPAKIGARCASVIPFSPFAQFPPVEPPKIRARIAIVMPIYHEETTRVAAGIRQTWASCRAVALDQHCDWYLLSDSTDAHICRQEERIVQDWRIGQERRPLASPQIPFAAFCFSFCRFLLSFWMAMRFIETPLQGAFLLELEKRGDERGFFARFFCQLEFQSHGLNPQIVQINNSFSRAPGTLRGLHYQLAPKAEEKIVRCLQGPIFLPGQQLVR